MVLPYNPISRSDITTHIACWYLGWGFDSRAKRQRFASCKKIALHGQVALHRLCAPHLWMPYREVQPVGKSAPMLPPFGRRWQFTPPAQLQLQAGANSVLFCSSDLLHTAETFCSSALNLKAVCLPAPPMGLPQENDDDVHCSNASSFVWSAVPVFIWWYGLIYNSHLLLQPPIPTARFLLGSYSRGVIPQPYSHLHQFRVLSHLVSVPQGSTEPSLKALDKESQLEIAQGVSEATHAVEGNFPRAGYCNASSVVTS